MTDILDIVARAPIGPAVLGWTVFGLAWLGAVLVLFTRGARRAAALARELEAMALAGEPQRARIRAREAPSTLAPVLRVLSGEARPEFDAPIRPLLLATLASALPPAAVLVGSLVVEAPSSLIALGASTAVLVPAGLLAGRALSAADAGSRRAIRAACVELLESNARAELERQRSAALQRRPGGEESPA